MSRKRRPGWGSSPTPGQNKSHSNGDDNSSKPESLAVAPPTELSRRVDKELDADRNFFKRWPQRQHYIRRIFPNERAQMEQQARAMGERSLSLDPLTQAVFVAVRKIHARARLCVTFIATRDIETDLSEAEAQELWGWVSSPQVEQIAAGLKATGP